MIFRFGQKNTKEISLVARHLSHKCVYLPRKLWYFISKLCTRFSLHFIYEIPNSICRKLKLRFQRLQPIHQKITFSVHFVHFLKRKKTILNFQMNLQKSGYWRYKKSSSFCWISIPVIYKMNLKLRIFGNLGGGQWTLFVCIR